MTPPLLTSGVRTRQELQPDAFTLSNLPIDHLKFILYPRDMTAGHALLRNIPRTFFHPLASPGAAFYARTLLALFRDNQSQGGLISRSRALEYALVGLEAEVALEETSHLDDEEPQFGWEDDGDLAAKRQARAGAVLRYLERCGWLRTEMQRDFRQMFLLPDYAFRFLGVFDALDREEALPLQGLVCSIHDLITAAAREGNAHVRLPEAQRQLIHFQNLLAELHHNMGVHLESVLTKASSSEVLRQFLMGYREDIVDKAYHQLRTTDHLSKFRPAIYGSLERMSQPDALAQASSQWSQAERHVDALSSRDRLMALFMDIAERVEGLDGRLEGLDERHAQFVDAAVRMVEKHVRADSTTSGHVHRILETVLHSEDETDISNTDSKAGKLWRGLEALVDIFEMSFVDSSSQFVPRKASEKFSEKNVRRKTPLKRDIAAAREKNVERMLKAMSAERVSEYARKLLALKDPLLASEIPLSGPQELSLLIYLRVYGNGRHGFFARTLKPHCWVRVHNVGFREFTLSSK